METEKAVLTPYEVADKLGLSLRCVYKQLKAGVIPCVKVGDKYLIPKSAFERWLNCQAIGPNKPEKPA